MPSRVCLPQVMEMQSDGLGSFFPKLCHAPAALNSYISARKKEENKRRGP